jgi:hypothetical protein
MAKSDACAGRLVRQGSIMTRNAELERRQLRNTIVAILIAAPFLAVATWLLVNVLFELFGSERPYANNFGVSIGKCQEIFRIVGTSENGQCSRRVPREHKTEMQLAAEVMALKIELMACAASGQYRCGTRRKGWYGPSRPSHSN